LLQFAKNLFMLHNLPQRFAVVVCLCGAAFAQGTGVWLDVPFVQQEKNGCGSAVIAMLLEYWHKQQPRPGDSPVVPAEIQRSLYSRGAHGIYSSDVEHYLQKQGFRTFTVQGDWDLLRKHLEKGRPLIVALKPLRGEASLHYVVVVGLDWQKNLLLINDPAQRKLLKVERAAFEQEWQAVRRWTLLAVPST
jgi:ABC-type bacteriocin/lantibiotic exporter with double-glycine peptidase domain